MMCIGPFVSYTTLNYMLLALPISCFTVNWWIPESPYYCLKEGKVNDARDVLKRIKTKNGKVSHIYFYYNKATGHIWFLKVDAAI